jgi:hypothetical protein
MAVVKIMGGLGNQLFQYAYALCMQKQGIHVTALNSAFYTNGEDQYHHLPLIHEFTSIPFDNSQHWTHEGYWQEYQYPEFVKDVLLAELLGHRRSLGDIPESECIVHVRRSRFANKAPASYYHDALAKVGDVPFTVLTDDVKWCEEQFSRYPNLKEIDPGDFDVPWKSFYMISKAKCVIMSNSTFSWWGAWLGDMAGDTHRIYTPTEWVAHDRSYCPARPNWIRVDGAVEFDDWR